MDMIIATNLREVHTIFSQTKAEISPEFLQFFATVSPDLSQLEDIGKETGVAIVIESEKVSVSGDWWSVISAHKHLRFLLNEYRSTLDVGGDQTQKRQVSEQCHDFLVQEPLTLKEEPGHEDVFRPEEKNTKDRHACFDFEMYDDKNVINTNGESQVQLKYSEIKSELLDPELEKQNLQVFEVSKSTRRQMLLKSFTESDDEISVNENETSVTSVFDREKKTTAMVREFESEKEPDTSIVKEENSNDESEWQPNSEFIHSDTSMINNEHKICDNPDESVSFESFKNNKIIIKETEVPEPIKRNGEHLCPSCDFVTKERGNFKEHFRRQHGVKKWKCEECGKVYGLYKELKRHVIKHDDPKHCCETCGKMFKYHYVYLKHKKTHAGDYTPPKWPCDYCGKVFCVKFYLSKHINAEHLGITEDYLCSTCGKTLKNKHSYLEHTNIHLGLKPHKCKICNKCFTHGKSLKEHQYVHEEMRRFKCEICNKPFKQKTAVRSHMKVHKSNKPLDHVCDVCGKGFARKQGLERHKRVHNGAKPYSCSFCGGHFNDSSIIRRHIILVHKKDPKNWKEGVTFLNSK